MMRPPFGFLRLHDAKGLLGAEEDPGEVGVDHLLPLVEAEVLQRHGRRADAGIVEEQTEPSERGLRLRKERRDLVLLADIAGHRDRRIGACAGLGDGALQRLPPAAGEDHGPAVPQQRVRRCLADPLPRAGDQRHFALGIHKLRSCALVAAPDTCAGLFMAFMGAAYSTGRERG